MTTLTGTYEVRNGSWVLVAGWGDPILTPPSSSLFDQAVFDTATFGA